MSAFYLACFSLYIWHVILYGTSSYLQPTIFQNFKLIYRIFNAILFHTTVSHRSSKNRRSTSSQRIAAHCELGTPWYLLTRTPGGPWSPLWEPVRLYSAQGPKSLGQWFSKSFMSRTHKLIWICLQTPHLKICTRFALLKCLKNIPNISSLYYVSP